MTSEKETFIRVLPARWRRKPAGIDMERNYVTVTIDRQAYRQTPHGYIDLPHTMQAVPATYGWLVGAQFNTPLDTV